jgi:predicted DNA-binding protein (MmcQ/YjbR family)
MPSKRAHELRERVLARALEFPETYVDHPWGETVVKVHKKVFVFAGSDDGDRVGFSVKLPESRDAALGLQDAAPTGYGLGRAGWVSITIGSKPPPRGGVLHRLEESYRAVAPKRLSRQLDLCREGPARAGRGLHTTES